MSGPDSLDLQISGLSVRFGGLVAVDRVTLTAPARSCTGLIGPNGAGKTTTFNACTGLVKPSAGRVELGGRDVTLLSPARRATLGLGRTFQRMELWNSLSVRDNVRLGREARYTGSNPLRHVWNRRSERESICDRAERATEICGIGPLSDARPGDLSTGQRRLVELARAVAAGFTMLLLDEPSSGLDQSETERFASVLRLMMSQEGVGILLVEHDMTLVMSVCSYIYVLDFGKPLFEGTPGEVASSAEVRSAYLGSTAVESMTGA